MLKFFKSSLIAAFLSMLFMGFTCYTDKDAIVIGSGGGFTGKVITYTINEKGNTFKDDGSGFKNFGKLSGNELHKIRKEIKKSGFYESTLRDPGNLYYFLETVHKGKNHKVTWGNQQSDESKKLQVLYNLILEKINQSKF
ncbi:MAG: hypothetical protein ACJ75J_05955 [Cytophagaceae bacterium]